jgi:type I restriction enzyme S subunit
MTTNQEWREFTIDQLLSLSNGINADKSAYGHGIPFINVLEVITHESLDTSDIPGRVTLPRKMLARYRVEHGDVLFNRTSETQEEVGLASVYLGDDAVVFGGFVFCGRPKTTDLDVDYSKYVFRAPGVRQQITARGQGGIRANIGQRDLKSVRVLLPSGPEQRAIARAIDDVTSLITILERLVAKKQAIKQGMMQKLLTGRTRLPGFDDDWAAEVEIADLAIVDPESLPSGTNPRTQIDYISLEDVRRGELLGSSHLAFGVAPSRARRVVRTGDVLFGTVRPNLQSHLLYTGELSNPIASTGFAVVRANSNADPAFIFNLLMSDLTVVQIDRIIAGSNYPAVSSRDVRRLSFNAPNVEEQRAIAEVLTDAEAEIAALRKRLAKARSTKTGIMQQLLTGRTKLPAKEVET